MKIGVTTTHAMNPYYNFESFLNESEFPYYVRGSLSLKKIMEKGNLDALIVWKEDGPELYYKNLTDPFFYHPSMAKNRIVGWRKRRQQDALIETAQLKWGDSFLDCTLGMGADALTASYFVGEYGKVTGLEYSPVIALMIKWGMKSYERTTPYEWLKPALNGVKVINADYNTYLKSLPDNSYDVVYFDPMFRKPVLESQAISVIRELANPEPLSLEAVKEACRVASRSVILKEKLSSGEFERLGFTVARQSSKSKIAYGKIEVTE